MTKIKIIILLVLSICIFSGCSDYNNLTDFIFIDSMHLKYTDNSYTITLHHSNPTSLLTQEQGSTQTKVMQETLSASDLTITSCIRKINHNTNNEINLTQLKSIIFDISIIENKLIDDFITFVKRTMNIYPTFNIFISNDKASDIYSIENPKELSSFYSLIGYTNYLYTIANLSYARMVSLHLIDFYTLAIPYLKVNKDILKSDEYKNTIEVIGVIAINIDGKHYIYEFDNYPGLNFIQNYKDKEVEINYDDISFNLEIESYRIDPTITDDILNLDIKVLCNNLNKEDNINYSYIIEEYIKESLITLLKDNISKELSLINVRLPYERLRLNISVFNT